MKENLRILLVFLFLIVFSPDFYSRKDLVLKIEGIPNFLRTRKYAPCPGSLKKMFKPINNMCKNDKTCVNSFLLSKLGSYYEQADQITIDHIDYAYTCLIMLSATNGKRCCPTPFYYSQKCRKLYLHDSKTNVLAKFNISTKFDEVFSLYHGFRFARKEILDYIRNKDVIDVGAFIGDSALVIAPYVDKKIHSFEISPMQCEEIKKVAKYNNIEDKVVVHNMGLTDHPTTFYMNSNKINSAQHVTSHGKIPIQMETIDNMVEKLHLTPGVIKADIEGNEYEMLKGAEKTIKKYRPIITVSVYHNYDNLFVVPDYVKSFGNYSFAFRAGSAIARHMGEMVMFAYPNEIGDFDSFDDNHIPY